MKGRPVHMTMTNPYQHPSAGPSYYPGSPVYGNLSPGPRQNFYPYPPPHHITAHSSSQYQHQTPSRGSHRGGHVNGSYSSRGSHHYHHTYHQQAPPYHPSLNSPMNGPPLSQHPGQHVSYSPQSAKHNSSYSPSYHYPSPNAPVFTPSWQTQSPISPLPKQLSMPPPPNARAYYDSSHLPSVGPTSAQQSLAIKSFEGPLTDASAPSTPVSVNSEITPAAKTAVLEPTGSSPECVVERLPVASESSTQSLKPPEGRETLVESQGSLYPQTGTIDTSEIPEHLPTTKPVAIWAIWSRRPQDPSQAPGIIISPKACPPPDIVQQALDLKTPPPSPLLSSSPRRTVVTPVDPVNSNTLKLSSDEASDVYSSQTNSTVPSSATTESEETSTVPGSPVSSHTSISVAGTPAKSSTEAQHSLPETEGIPTNTHLTSTSSTVDPVITTHTSDSAVCPTATAEADATKPMPTVALNDVTSLQLQQPMAPPALKKSWASLLRDPSSSSSPGNSLPSSSVVGFSIPAASKDLPPVPVPLPHKSELVNLLTTFPAPTTTAGHTAVGSISIQPRGLVNSGNMCFANSVLQVLVYCPPFHKLFVELAGLLASDNVRNKDNSTTKILADGSTLINATACFLQEFLGVNEGRNKSDSVHRTGINNSSGSGVKGGGKGKEKEIKDEISAGDNWDESFLPSYVYDVMKTKKRFDTMRVCHTLFHDKL